MTEQRADARRFKPLIDFQPQTERSHEMKRDILFALAAMAILVLVASPAGASKKDPACSVGPSQAALSQSWTLSAFGLPTGASVNLITTYPNGTTLTAPVSVAADGTYSLTQSSASSLPANQTGTYGYQFVGKVRWPSGTFSQSYATCSLQVA
jgi:hypothetical protein